MMNHGSIVNRLRLTNIDTSQIEISQIIISLLLSALSIACLAFCVNLWGAKASHIMAQVSNTIEAIPGAFNGLPQAPWIDNFATVIYFSFVTITTLGYGDISPALPLARFLVYMEAIVGVFYMAILVASLIGVRMSGREAEKKQ